MYIAYERWFMAGEQITVGDEVLFGLYRVVTSSNHSRINRSFRYGEAKSSPICIGRGTWVQSHVIISAGSQTGSGVLLVFNAVVTGYIPSNVMAGGMPARTIKEF